MSIQPDALPALDDSLRRFLTQHAPDGRMVVGIVAPVAKRALRAESDLVMIDSSFVAHQRHRHSEVPLEDHAMMQLVLADPTVVLQQTSERLLMLKRVGLIYVLAIKTTASRKENWALSFWAETIKAARRHVKNHILIFGDPAALEVG